MTDLEAVAAEGLALSDEFKKYLRDEISRGLTKKTVRQISELSGILAKLMRADATVLKESRALEEAAKDKAKRLTHEGKRKVVLAVVQDLPPEQVLLLKAELGW